MNGGHDPDKQFHENLEAVGRQVSAPETPSSDLRDRCAGVLAAGGRVRRRENYRVFRRPAILSTVGLAAAIALAVGLLFPTNGGPQVQAATVLEKLSEQVAEDDLLEVVLDSLVADGASINGRLQVASEGIAGDLQVSVHEDSGELVVELDVSLGISEDGGWVLLRQLHVQDPEAQAMLNLFLPADSDTLLIIPKELVHDAAPGLKGDIAEVRILASGQVVEFIKEVLKEQASVGVSTEPQSDGTVLLTMTVEDAESIRKLAELAAATFPDALGGEAINIDESDVEELRGCTLTVVYDPTAEAVRSFSISDLQEIQGTITVSLTGGKLDPDLLDPDRVTGPNTRRIDLGALQSVIESLEDAFDDAD